MSGKLTWAIEIRKNTGTVVWAWPYNTFYPTYPPYPGFDVLERWLEKNYSDISLQRLYNNGSPVLEITFASEEDAFMFVLSAGQNKDER